MNSISRGWLFIIGFALVAILVFAARGFGSAGNIQGAIELGPDATTEPALPYAGAATAPKGVRTSTDDRNETNPAPVPTGVLNQLPDTIYSDGDQILPLNGNSKELAAYAGDRATALSVPVQSVVADEGFWVGNARDRVWVQLIGPPPESPYHVVRGDQVTFVGQVVTHGAGFPAQVGVDRSEGAATLAAQGAHLAVAKETLVLAP